MIPTMLQNLGPVLIALVVILVLSASMSTLSSLVIASSSTLTIDFLKETFMKKMDDKKQLLLIRILVVVFIAISAVLALIQYKSSITFIAQLMGISWGALAGAFWLLPVRPVLEKDHQGGLLGILYLRLRPDAGGNGSEAASAHHHAKSHQLRRHRHAGGTGHRAGGKSNHTKTR